MLEAFEHFLLDSLEGDYQGYVLLQQAAHYALSSRGSRLRPRLCMAVAQHFDCLDPQLFPLCAALEYVHTYSLIHDDLPALDNDDMRRGMPSLHKKFGEDIAILTGDFLLTKSFEILASGPQISLRQALQILSKASGAHGMIGGQVLDIQQGDRSLETLICQHKLKTGALFGASMALGALFAQQPIEPWQTLGQEFGFYYQVLDDLYDPLTKNSDAKQGKHTAYHLLAHEDILKKTQAFFDHLSTQLPTSHPLIDEIWAKKSHLIA